MVVYCEAITAKVYLYPRISWGKPTFAVFQITTIYSRRLEKRTLLNEMINNDLFIIPYEM